jgi:membrane dipeptidase
MRIIDTHCDALLKMQQAKRGIRFNGKLDFRNAPELETNLERLKQGGVKVQFFAIFIHPDVPASEKWQHALEQADIFHKEIIGKHPEMKHIRHFSDIEKLEDWEIGAVLALEGADCIGNDLMKLRTLYRLGVLSVSLTWNFANYCADGAKEPRGGGLTTFGKEVVELNNEYGMLTDVSHLADASFWDVLETARYPFASHSNARAVTGHERNLPDDAVRALIEKDGFIHVVFNPPFVAGDGEEADISDLIRHIDHLCGLGAEKQLGFGSDFDGISTFVDNLTHAGEYPNLLEELLKKYSEETVRGFAFDNFVRQTKGINPGTKLSI